MQAWEEESISRFYMDDPFMSSDICPDEEESVWFCPACAMEGDENKLVYVTRYDVLICKECDAQFENEMHLAEAYRDALFEKCYEQNLRIR